MNRSYSELIRFPTFLERFNYLKLDGSVGEPTFGSQRYLNQTFYRSEEWKKIRNHVILRDLGCDLGIEDYQIFDQVIIHHMNPVTEDNIKHNDQCILDPEFLICTSKRTHNAIHYGDSSLLPQGLVTRTPGDTTPWL